MYLAALYYSTGHYLKAIDHCTLVMRSPDHSQCSSHVVQGELLPKIDDNIDTVLGLSVFYQYVRTAALNQQQTQHVSVFTTELFAHYLHIQMSVSYKVSTNIINRYTKYLTDAPQLSITDVLLYILSSIHGTVIVKRQLKGRKEQRNKMKRTHWNWLSYCSSPQWNI